MMEEVKPIPNYFFTMMCILLTPPPKESLTIRKLFATHFSRCPKFSDTNALEDTNLAGNKNSGRKGYRHEIQAREAIDLSFRTIIMALSDDTLSLDLKLKAAIPIASKALPDKVEINDVNALTNEQRMKLAEFVSMALLRRAVNVTLDTQSLPDVA